MFTPEVNCDANPRTKLKTRYLVQGYAEKYTHHFHDALIDMIAAYCATNNCVWRLRGDKLQRFIRHQKPYNYKTLQYKDTICYKDVENNIYFILELHLFAPTPTSNNIGFCWKLKEAEANAFILFHYRMSCTQLDMSFEYKTKLNFTEKNDIDIYRKLFNDGHGWKRCYCRKYNKQEELIFYFEIIKITKVEKYLEKYSYPIHLINEDAYQLDPSRMYVMFR
eukprot:UN01902